MCTSLDTGLGEGEDGKGGKKKRRVTFLSAC